MSTTSTEQVYSTTLSDDAQSSAEASEILAITRDVCQKLGIRWIPDKVSWAEVYLSGDMTSISRTFPVYSDVPGDHPVMFRDTLFVAPSMMGRLQPEEWRPIVASSMIYYAKMATRKTLGIAVRVTSLVLLAAAGLIALLLAGLGFWDFMLLLLAAYLGVTLGAGFLLVPPYERGLWLKADRIAADYAGPLVMLRALEKVQELHITELEGGRASNKPSLAQRIAKLKQYWISSA